MNKLRVWWSASNLTKQRHINVDSVEEAIKVLNDLANNDLKDGSVVWNAGGLEEFDKDFIDDDCDGWVEYYDEEGRDIKEIIDDLKENKND